MELAHTFKGSGFEVPEEKRAYANNDKLEAIFQQWVKEAPALQYKGELSEAWYQLARRLLKDETFDANAIHALVAQEHARKVTQPEDKKVSIDEFAAAAYNKAEDQVIVFEGPTAEGVRWGYRNIGYKLTQGKVLINKTPAGDVGFRARGAIINYERASKLGNEARGPFINYGQLGNPTAVAHNCRGFFVTCADMPDDYCEKNFIPDSWGNGIGYLAQGPIINFGNMPFPAKRKQWGEEKIHTLECGKGASSLVISNTREKDASGNITKRITLWAPIPLIGPRTGELKLDNCEEFPELADYINNLKARFEEGRTDYNKAILALESLGPKPERKLAEDITAILRRCLL